jgi:hypothetical protein
VDCITRKLFIYPGAEFSRGRSHLCTVEPVLTHLLRARGWIALASDPVGICRWADEVSTPDSILKFMHTRPVFRTVLFRSG